MNLHPAVYRALPDAERSRLRRAWRELASRNAPDARAATPNGAPFPLRSWPPDAALDIQHLAEWADPFAKQGIPRFANAAARDAAIPAPVEGQACYLLDLKQYQGRGAAGWYPVGGVMPQMFLNIPGRSLAAGLNTLTGANASTSAGAEWTISQANGTATLPFTGQWSITAYLALTGDLPLGYNYSIRPCAGGSPLFNHAVGGLGPSNGMNDSSQMVSAVFGGTAGGIFDLRIYAGSSFVFASAFWRLQYLSR